MKNWIFMALFLTIGCNSEHKVVTDVYPNGNTEIEYVYPDRDHKSYFSIIEYFENGNLRFKGEVQNLKFIGQKIVYYQNGQIRQIDSLIAPCLLDNCCCDGIVKRYYSNGNLKQVFGNKRGLTHGISYIYSNDSSGILTKQKSFRSGKKNGLTTTYYESGGTYKLETYKNDTLIGEVYYFDSDGDTLKIRPTWLGKEDLPSKKWLKNGQIFKARYLGNSFDKAIYIWEDKNGTEIRREIVSPKIGGKWITESGNWSTPN